MRNNAKKYIPLIIFVACILIFAIFFFVFNFFKDETIKTPIADYKITNYVVDINVNEDNSYDVVEIINVDFLQRKHGIFRYLPIYQSTHFKENDIEYLKNYKIQYSNISCSENVDIYTEDNFLIMQIGSAELTYIGPKTYTIRYKLSIGDDKIPEFDHFYYNIIGQEWGTTIARAEIKISFDKPITQTKAYFYIGNNEVEVNKVNNSFIYIYNQQIPAFSGITARVSLEEGYFSTQKASIVPDILLLVASIIFLILVTIWIVKKNNNKQPIPVVEFTAPEGITSADAGYLIDRIVNKKDIASLIVYWANKGFIKIVDQKDNCQLLKLKETDETFKSYEKELFDALFKNKNIIELSDTNEGVAIAVNNAKKSIQFENNSKNFSTPRIFMRVLLFIVLTALVFGTYTYLGEKLALPNLNIVLSTIFTLAICTGIAILIFVKEIKYSLSKTVSIILNILALSLILGISIYLAYLTFDMYSNPAMISIFIPIVLGAVTYLILKINIRTEDGNKRLGSLIGLREFILVTEKDRIKMLIKDDPTLFYDILPYAYVLGVSDIWINKFEGLIIEAPDWYDGNYNTNIFFGYYLINAMNSTNKFYSRSLVKFNSNKTNSGGFGGKGGFGGSGGGFRGGGFGGGGGGSW
jgi:uncharacterized membrane protein YgcG